MSVFELRILITLIYGILLLLYIIEQNKTYNYPRCGGSDYHIDIVKHFKDRDYRDHMSTGGVFLLKYIQIYSNKRPQTCS
jgi:3-phosphoglycerate kinase